MADEAIADAGPADEKPLVEQRLSLRELPDEVRHAREAQRMDDLANEKVAKPRMEAQIAACRMALEQLKAWHRRIADRTDLDLAAYSRGSALWLVSGRSLGLLEALIVQAEAGIDTEAMVTARTLHEANRVLLVFCDPDEEELLRLWLDDEGKQNFVRAGAARKAQGRWEDKLDEAMRDQELPSIGSTVDLSAQVYDRMSRVAHNRRSTCISGLWEDGREFAYGRQPSVIRRAAVVEWISSMTGEVLNCVGDALRAFYGEGFFVKEIAPLVLSVTAVRETSPLDEASIRSEAGT